MPHTNDSLQAPFDPHYEWQGEHYEWQGSKVHTIQENINPGNESAGLHRGTDEPSGVLNTLKVVSTLYVALVLMTPMVLLWGFVIPPLLLVFWLLFVLCGLGGLVLPLAGLATRSLGVFASGALGLGVFLMMCYGVYFEYFSGVTMPR